MPDLILDPAGRSARMNEEDIRRFSEIPAKYGCACSKELLQEMRHLLTGVNDPENRNLPVSGEFGNKPDAVTYNKYIIPETEACAAD